MNGAEALLESLKREGVDVLFGISGGAICRSTTRWANRRHLEHPDAPRAGRRPHGRRLRARHWQSRLLHRHERAGRDQPCHGDHRRLHGFDAGRVSLGQVATPNIGKDAFQECDTFGITMPIVKHSYMVKRASDIPRIVKEAFYIAGTGRPGPVLIDIPKDMGEGELGEFFYPEEVKLRGYNPEMPGAEEQIKAAAKLIAEAKQPVLYVGNGVNQADAADDLLKLAEKIGAPVTTTLLGRGAFPGGHALALDMLGMHGTAYANWAVHNSDLLIALGARFDDRVTGNPEEVRAQCESDSRRHRLGGVGQDSFRAGADSGRRKTVIKQLTQAVAPQKNPQWLAQIDQWKKDAPLTYQKDGKLKPQFVISEMEKATKGEAIVTTDVGQHQMWAAQYYNPRKTRSFITSGGLGTMGYGYPAAIGAKVGCIDREVWCITGDGSFQMNIQELATGVLYDIPVKIAVLNNSSLGMVRQWQKMFYERRWSGIDLSKCPDFAKVAEAYSATGVTVTEADEVADAIREAQKNPGTVVLNFMTDAEEDVFPMIPGGKTIHDMVLDSSHKAVPIPGNGNGPERRAGNGDRQRVHQRVERRLGVGQDQGITCEQSS
jgi:acetolactate synthase-1/2/3 large subunit